jgi:hypothetical protein
MTGDELRRVAPSYSQWEGGCGTEETSCVQKWIAGKTLNAATPFIGSRRERSGRPTGYGGCAFNGGRPLPRGEQEATGQ